MTLVLLIACMHEKDTSIIQRSNVQSDVIVVNQCDHNSVEEFDFENQKGRKCHAKFICTTERGLSRSRNMALRNAWGDICLICDDDELMEVDYEVAIIGQYLKHKDSIVNTFSLIRKDCARTYSASPKKLGFLDTLHTNSLQISFNRKLVLDNNILFDEMMGSGTGNGGGEENRFMMDCYKTGYSVKNHDKYNECISMRVMLYSAFEGFFENRINKCAKKYIGVNKLMISTPLYYNVKPLLLAA